VSARMDIRGVYRFSSLVKQNKKAKNYAVFCFAGKKKLLFYIYAVIVKQKIYNAPLITTWDPAMMPGLSRTPLPAPRSCYTSEAISPPDRALCLPTFSHFVIVNKTSFSLSLSDFFLSPVLFLICQCSF
jgi:hypothetical protein